MKKLYYNLCIIGLLGLAVLISNCGEKTHSKTKKDSDKVVIPVETAFIKNGDISAYFAGTATLEAEEETDVVAKVGGVVKKIYVEEGTSVKIGQTLAKLDDEKLKVQLNQTEATLNKIKSAYNRSEELFNKKLISTDEFQKTKYEYEHQKAVYDLAKLELNYSSIKSPISGVVAQRMVKVGNMVLPNQATFKVTDLDPLIAILYVPERQMVKLKVNQTAKLRVDAIEDSEFMGCIKRISPIVDPATGTVKVTIEMNDPSNSLKPGMFARINIIHDVHSNTVLAPKDAIISEDNESSVFIVKGDSIVFRQLVEIGYINTNHVEIIKGLSVLDTVVTTGKGSLKDSSIVEIVSSK